MGDAISAILFAFLIFLIVLWLTVLPSIGLTHLLSLT